MPRKGKKDAGWGEEYVELESETAALLNSIRKGPDKTKETKKPIKSSPKRRTKKRNSNGNTTPKGRRKTTSSQQKQQRKQQRTRRNSHDIDDNISEQQQQQHQQQSEVEPNDTFASLISTTVSSNFEDSTSRSKQNNRRSPNRGGGGRRRRRPSGGASPMSSTNGSTASSTRSRDTNNLESSMGSEDSQEELEPPSSDRSSATEDNTPRQSDSNSDHGSETKTKDETPVQKENRERLEALGRARSEEARLRELSFRDEESRVREGLDGFVPHKVTQVASAVKELDTERDRLDKVEATINKRGKTRLDNLSARDRRVAEMNAATDIQRLTRGKVGRRKALIKKKQLEMKADGITLLPPLHPELPGPDPTTYGPQAPDNTPKGSGSANVDMDDSNYLLGEDDQDDERLPSLHLSLNKKSRRRNNGGLPPRPMSASSTVSSLSTASSDLDLDEAIPVERTPRLFLPDGSPDIKLRDTVRNALKVSRFDSVSTLLASGPLARKVRNATAKMKRSRNGVRSTGSSQAAVVDRVRDMHEPYRGTDGKEAGGGSGSSRERAPFNVKSSSGASSTIMSPSKKGKRTKDHGPPAMYEVSHGGFDTGERTEADESMSDTASEAGSIVSKSSKSGKRRKKRQVCFACWSAGDDMVKRCDMHEEDENAPDDGRDDSILMCGNWNVHALRRRYRAEELQEVFAKAVSSLRWDLNRKQFVTVIECRHPIYRMINGLLETLQKRKSRMDHARAWFKSILEDLRCGKIKGLSEKQKQKSKMLAAKDSMMNFAWTQRYAREARIRQPKPPVTATEMSGLVGAAELRRTQHHGLLIIAPPTPVPVMLYKLRVYVLPLECFVRVPKPSHSFSPYEGEESKAKGFLANRFIGDDNNKAWLEMLCQTWSNQAADQATSELYQSAPPVEKYRTKYPRAVTVKYATFARKEVKHNMAMGGLSAMAILCQKVTTLIPPQYGNFVVIDRRSIAPRLRENVSADFPTLQPWDPPPPCSCRAVVSALDTRYTPTVTVSASAEGRPKPSGGAAIQEVEDEGEGSTPEEEMAKAKAAQMIAGIHYMENWTGCTRLYHGDNRPEQTGESDYAGFATTSHTPGLEENMVLDSTSFTPSVDVAVPNKAGNHGTVCSQADINYPFCVPSTRPNTMYDFYELLVNDKSSSNQACCFTVLGKQDPGDFGVKNNMKGKFGPLVTRVYRSYGYMQHLDDIEEFKTPEGVSYWYNARTGETVWEKPLALEDGYMDSDDDEEGDGLDPLSRAESTQVTYSENKMRKHLLADYEANASNMEENLAVSGNKSRLKLSMLKELPGPSVVKNPNSGQGQLPPVPLAFQPGTARSENGGMNTSRSRMGDSALIRQTDPTGNFQSHTQLQNPTPRGSGTPRLNNFASASASSSSTTTSTGAVVPSLNTKSIHSSSNNLSQSKQQPQQPQQSQQPHVLTNQNATMSTGPVPQYVPSQNPAAQQQDMLNFFTSALQNVMPALQQQMGGASDGDSEKMLRLGLGLGLGMAMQATNQQQQQQQNRPPHQQQQQQQQQRSGSSSLMDSRPSGPNSHAITNGNKVATSGSHSSGSGPKRGGVVHVLPQATPPPDEMDELERRAPPAANVVVREHKTHPPATEMVTFQPVGGEQKTRDAPIKRSAASLPEGFIASVFESHTGKQHVDYLPSAANLNVPREAGVVKPNNISEVWEKAGYDPWSAGKDPYATVFVPSLNFEEEDVADVPEDDMADKEGLTKFQLEQKQANKEAEDLKYVFSKARHGQYQAIEEKFDEPEWTVDIDAQDPSGATLLHIACQNGNRRIAKFCLRKGANINQPNLAGNTPLHFCFAYGFEDLGEYLMDKGGDDSVVNADGLTCYEGLNMESVEQI